MASSSFSSVPFSTPSYTHDVFLSFRGPDTRRGFTDHLYMNLVNRGIKTFIDDGLPRGEEISQSHLRAIEGSKLSLIVFSENYAASKWCLDELVHILECGRSKNQMVRPIFYKVDPLDVRYQRGTYHEALAEHEGRINKDRVLRWREALSEATNLPGWKFKSGYDEYELIGVVIDKIIEEISPQVKEPSKLDLAEYPFGIDSRVQDMLEILDVGGIDVRMVGIWGIGGIGKTTIAKAVYNTIAHQFEYSCFLANVRELSEESGGLVKLQNALLSCIVKEKRLEIKNVHEGITLLRERLRLKKILLVLDDVDDLGQLEKLAGKIDWFGRGSRVIITTRDMSILKHHKVNLVYEVTELNDQDALELFNFFAFKGDEHKANDFCELATALIRHVKGIPLVLEVLGSDLCCKNKDEWKDVLEYYTKHPKQEVQEILQRSYEALEDPMKVVFLHIAWFFKGREQSYVIYVLESCGLNPMYCLRVLQDRALIKIGKDNSIWMHDLIEDTGKEMAKQEYLDEAGNRGRLRVDASHYKFLENTNIGASHVSTIHELPKQMATELFQLKSEIKLGSLHTALRMAKDIIKKWSKPHGIPFKIPFQIMSDLIHLSHINLLRSDISRPVEGFMIFKNLVYLKLQSCQFLKSFPDASGLPNLCFLELNCCTSLVKIDDSVGFLKKLVYLSLYGCRNLIMFPRRIALKSVKRINFRGCRRLENLPEIVGEMELLTRLDLRGTAIKELSCSVGNLTGLKSLSLKSCCYLIDVPSSIFYELHSLEVLDLSNCNSLVTFPTKSETLAPPVSSTTLTGLYVNLSGCHRLEEVSEFPLEIHVLNVTNCHSLERISKLTKFLEGKDSKMFGKLYLTDCNRLCSNLATARGLALSTVEEADELMGEAEKEQETKEMVGKAEELTDPWARFLLYAKSEEFRVLLDTMFPIPEWFTCSQDVDEIPDEEHEFCTEIPQNCKGLALCMQTKYPGWKSAIVYSINGIEFGTYWMKGGRGMVHYIPLVTVKKKLSKCGMPPANDMFRVKVMFPFKYEGTCGVHLIEDSEGEGHQVTNMSSQPPSISILYKRETDPIKGILLRDQFSSEYYTNHPIQDLEEISERIQVASYLENTNIGARHVSTINELQKRMPKRMRTESFQQKSANKLPRPHPFMPFLISINLWECDGLTRIPDLSRLTRLKNLKVSHCDDLVEVDPSVGRLDKLVNLDIQSCTKLERFPEKINLKSLETLVLSYCYRLEFFPEIEGDMKSLKSLDLSRTAIKELPCSVGNLTGLKSLSLKSCCYLIDVPSSIFNELHSLEKLDLSNCNNLVTFPTKSETLAPPVSSTTLTGLYVNLSGCHRLEEVSEFPLEIHVLNVTNCHSLERISKLTKILEGKDSKMFGKLYLTDCNRLCSNLATARGLALSAVEEADELMGEAEKEQETKEMVGKAEELTDPWARFLLCAKSEEFRVLFDTMFPIPEWFTCSQDVDEIPDEEHEFCTEIPQNCKGLALCMQTKYPGWKSAIVYSINGIEFGTYWMKGGRGMVHYIPLVTVKKKLSKCGMPPANDMFRVKVMFPFKYGGTCGVHLIEDSEGEGHQVTNMSSQPPSISILYKRETDPIKGILLRDQFSSEYYTNHPIQDLEEISERIQVASFLENTNIGARHGSTINELQKRMPKRMRTESFQQKSANKLPRPHPTVRIAKAIIKKWSEPHGIPFNATALAEIPFLLRSDVSRPVEGFKIFIFLTSLNLESCQFLKSFPDASGLPNLRNLNLDCCRSLVKIDDSVGFLEKLVDLSLSGCHNLVMFPRRIALKSVESINFRGCRRLESLPEIVGEMELLTWLDLSGTAIKEVPSTIGYLINLEELILRDCQKLTNLSCCIYELQHLWCLDLQCCTRLVTLPSWNAESLPKNSSISPDLWYLNLRGCKRLEEISELPPKVQWVNAADCVQLERFAKLSNILVRKESEMIKYLLLSNCQKLYDNLAHDVAKRGRLLLNEVSLCSLFLSCTQSEFEVLFPGNKVPRWFSGNKHVNLLEPSEVSFEIPRSFKLGNKGLAICAAFAVETTTPKQEDFMQSNLGDCTFTAKIDINGASTVTRSFSFESKDVASAHVWLCYIPFIMLAYHHSPLPLKCGVHVEHISQGSVRCKSYGVHLVTPQDEDEDEDEDGEA